MMKEFVKRVRLGFRAFRDFRQQHLFVFPKEARAAIAIARQLSVEELEEEKGRFGRASDYLIKTNVQFRRSCRVVKVEQTIDATLFDSEGFISQYTLGDILSSAAIEKFRSLK